jgi:hypothetical protein
MKTLQCCLCLLLQLAFRARSAVAVWEQLEGACIRAMAKELHLASRNQYDLLLHKSEEMQLSRLLEEYQLLKSLKPTGEGQQGIRYSACCCLRIMHILRVPECVPGGCTQE